MTENQHLHEEVARQQDLHCDDTVAISVNQRREALPDPNTSVQNPLMGDSAWLRPRGSPAFSMYIGEATSTAFAGLLHQCLTGSLDPILVDQEAYTGHSVLKSLMNTELRWPSQAQAYLLAKVALNHLDPVFYSVLAAETLDQIQGVYLTNNFDDPVIKCKLFALFALGEVFSNPCTNDTGAPVPGTAYYARAMEYIVFLPERPCVTLVESLLLLVRFPFLAVCVCVCLPV